MGIKNKLEKIARLAMQSVNMIYYNFKAKAYKNDSKYRDLWIISERGTEAKDNGFCFFEYLCKNHPEINARYVIDKKAAGEDYKKLLAYEDRLIEYGGEEHKIAYILASHAISS